LYPSLQPALIARARHHLVNEAPALRHEIFRHIGAYLRPLANSGQGVHENVCQEGD
jgi:hypothetical protein